MIHGVENDQIAELIRALEEMADKGEPMKYHKLHRIVAEGNMVMTQSEGNFGGIATAIWDLYRIENGKIVEHWDAIWEKDRMPEKFQHDNTLF